MKYDLQTFGLRDMIDAGRRLRQQDDRYGSMEEAAASIVDFFHDNLSSGDDRNCVLVRCFKSHPFGDLPPDLQQKAASLLQNHHATPKMQCLTLLASRGASPEWNSRFTSAAHQVIPLPTVQRVGQAPMISQLVLDLGMKIEHVVNPVAQAACLPRFDVFHVESAVGSAVVPDQETFVRPFGVKSVLGFGGLLPAGELFAVILFTRVPIPPQTAALFRTLALGVKLRLLPFSGKRIFAES